MKFTIGSFSIEVEADVAIITVWLGVIAFMVGAMILK